MKLKLKDDLVMYYWKGTLFQRLPRKKKKIAKKKAKKQFHYVSATKNGKLTHQVSLKPLPPVTITINTAECRNY